MRVNIRIITVLFVVYLVVACGGVRLNPSYFPGSAETVSPAGIRITANEPDAWVGLVRAEQIKGGHCIPIPYEDTTYRPTVKRWKSIPAVFRTDELDKAACWILMAYRDDERPKSNYVSPVGVPSTSLVVGGNDLVPESHHFEFGE